MMKKLTEKENQIMQAVWRLKKAFIRDIVEELPEPRPHYNSVATIVKIMVKKNFLTSERVGNTYQYRPAVTFEKYREGALEDIKEDVKKKYFGNSFPKMLAHFARSENMSDEELQELIDLIKSQKE